MDESSPSLSLAGPLTICEVDDLKSTLLTTDTLQEIDLSGVTEIDTAGVQLLMMAKKVARSQERELRLVAHSARVIEAFELLNLAAYFNDPLVMMTRTPHEE
jgi:anti-anti-sigma regulatory factor